MNNDTGESVPDSLNIYVCIYIKRQCLKNNCRLLILRIKDFLKSNLAGALFDYKINLYTVHVLRCFGHLCTTGTKFNLEDIAKHLFVWEFKFLNTFIRPLGLENHILFIYKDRAY